jgi:Histidine kinase-, DNA gyrase B-, and HSP90-like ATPase
VRAAIAETEDLDRVVFAIDDRIAVSGSAVADLTHLLAELTENAVRFSPPDTAVTIRARPDRRDEGGYLLTIEDWGVGMPAGDIIAANELLASPREVDLAVAQRLGFHVVARLAARHGISVSLGNTPGSGVTAVVALPAALFAAAPTELGLPFAVGVTEARPYVTGRVSRREPRAEYPVESTGWVEPVSTAGTVRSTNGSARPRWAAVPTETLGSNRHGLDGAPDGGWRGWWNPESVGSSPTRHSDRQPVDSGSGEGVAEIGADEPMWQPSPTPRPRQALPAVPPATSGAAPEPDGADGAEVAAEPDIPTPRRNGEAVTGAGKPELRRRVPQAHLAPELRQPVAEETGVEPQIDGAAASALSRYQASRQAAQAVVEDSGTAGGMRQ